MGPRRRVQTFAVDSALDDDDLITRSNNGDQRATEIILTRHYDRVLAVCQRTMGNTEGAADAAQNALISIARGLKNFNKSSAFTTWVHRIAVNAAIDELRKHNRRSTAELPTELPDLRPSMTDRIADRELIQLALSRLSQAHREVIVLREFGEYDYDEIAARLDVPVGTVRSRLARARADLLRELRNLDPAAVSSRSSRPNGDDHGTVSTSSTSEPPERS